MIKYRAEYISCSIKKIEIVRETEKFVVLPHRVGETKEAKVGDYHGYFDSFSDAKRWLYDRYSIRSEALLRQAREYGEKASSVLRMAESND